MAPVASLLSVAGIDPSRLRRRVARSAATMHAQRAELDRWLARMRGDARFDRFPAHFDVLETVLTRLLDRLGQRLDRLPARTEPGAGYELCRGIDRDVVLVRRIFDWYAAKYEQRFDTRYRDVLAAADELARSCWMAPFAATGTPAPAGPVCFVDNRHDGSAMRRCDVPADLRAASDDAVAGFVSELPIPVIALPEAATREASWLVLAAHETGHHVQQSLGLETATRHALWDAVGPAPADDWIRWQREVFADAYSVLMIGGAAVWAVEELQHASALPLLRPSNGHPAPVVRLALLGELLHALGVGKGAFDADSAYAWLAAVEGPGREAVFEHLDAVPRVARALLDVPMAGKTLRALARTDVLAADGRRSAWAAQLSRPEPVLTTVNTGSAPRVLIAAGVDEYANLAASGRDDLGGRLHANLVSALARSGAPGVRGTVQAGIDALAERLSDRFLGKAPERRTPSKRLKRP